MTPAVASLIGLLIAIVLSCTTRINVGLLAIGMAWGIGVYLAGWTPDVVASGFPTTLFLTLTGVTLLFALAETNGTLERLAERAVSLARGNARLLPLLFFAIACAISTVGPGAILSVALIAPLALPIGARAGVPYFLSALMVANGANAGNLSPISAVGVIANTQMAKAGIVGHEGKVWAANFVAHVAVALAAYLLLGGRRLPATQVSGGEADVRAALDRRHWWTIAVIGVWIVGAIGLKLSIGLSAFAAATILVLIGASAEGASIKRIPWGVIIMVSGVTLLIGVLERSGGMDLFTTLLARLASRTTVNGVIAFVTGLISTYSSTSGVVLPAFLPSVPGLIQKLGGGDPLAVSLSINVGASLVDVSPLSTLGALCIAVVSDEQASRDLFRKLLLWGLAMSVVGAALCAMLAGPMARL